LLVSSERQRAGIGGILFAVSLVVGFTLFGPKGGQYSADEVAAFVGQGNVGLMVSVYLLLVSIIGLIALISYLSETWIGSGRQRRTVWGASLAAGATFLVGWALYLTAPTSTLAGGPAIAPAISYALMSGGMLVFFGAGGALLGIALAILATRGTAAPSWIRVFTGLTGLAALSSWAFLLATGWSPNQWLPGPSYLVILWGLVTGVWLLISPATPEASARTDG
jgi:hypothetical protein